MEKVDADWPETAERRLRIVPIMVFVDPKCHQCIRLVEVLDRKGFECNVLDVNAASSKKFLKRYSDALASASEQPERTDPHPVLDLSDSSYDDIDWNKVHLPFSHPVLLTPEGFYVYPDFFRDHAVNGSTVDEELLDQIMIFLVRIWN